jgi:hypothetical protein
MARLAIWRFGDLWGLTTPLTPKFASLIALRLRKLQLADSSCDLSFFAPEWL